MKKGDMLDVNGAVTQQKFILGRRMHEIERILGFHQGRLADGCIIVGLLKIPASHEFNVGGYTNVASHHFNMPQNLDPDTLKDLAMAAWSLSGPNQLVKVLPNVRHSPGMEPDLQYPPGLGVPQWEINRNIKLPGRVLFVTDDANAAYTVN